MKKILFFLFFSIFSLTGFSEELVKIDALDGRISLYAPKNFTVMSEEALDIKYPKNGRPSDVLTDESTEVNLVFNYTANALQLSQVKDAHAAISNIFHSKYPTSTWIRDEVIQQSGQDFMVLELIAPVEDTEIHNIIYATSVDGKLLLAAFNATVEKSDEWVPIGREIMNSISVN